VNSLGKRLRAARKKRGWTLAQLGQQVGLSVSYLSQVEREATMPSLPTLTAIARAFSVDVRDFFEEEEAPPCVVRSSQGKTLRGTENLLVELLSADPLGKSILPYRVTCQPGASCERPSSYPGEECGFILKGELTVTVGEETVRLKVGDSIHYQRHQPHAWRNEGNEECIVIWVASPPIKEDEVEG
jgi:transcriptional regulator with XRE-family HTH domain